MSYLIHLHWNYNVDMQGRRFGMMNERFSCNALLCPSVLPLDREKARPRVLDCNSMQFFVPIQKKFSSSNWSHGVPSWRWSRCQPFDQWPGQQTSGLWRWRRQPCRCQSWSWAWGSVGPVPPKHRRKDEWGQHGEKEEQTINCAHPIHFLYSPGKYVAATDSPDRKQS